MAEHPGDANDDGEIVCRSDQVWQLKQTTMSCKEKSRYEAALVSRLFDFHFSSFFSIFFHDSFITGPAVW